MKLAFTFFAINSYIVTLQICAGCLTIFFVYVEFWKQAQKMPTVSTNQVFILRLLLTAITTELRTFASHPHDISYCCYAWWLQSFWPLCFWRICPNPMSAYQESLKVKRSVACSPICTANVHKMHESIKTIAIAGAQKSGALGQEENFCASDSPAIISKRSVPMQEIPRYAMSGLQFITV